MIHPEFPFTEEEIAAGWIVLGWTVEDARLAARDLRRDLALPQRHAEREEGWFSHGSRAMFSEGVVPMFQMVADVRSGGTFLSTEAWRALHDGWTYRLGPADADAILSELGRLGPEWRRHRAALRGILTGNGEGRGP